MSVTFEELAALAIDTRNLPPMTRNAGRNARHDSKRGAGAKRATIARRNARTLKLAATGE